VQTYHVRTGFVVPTGIVVVGRVSLLFPLMYAVGGGACRCACRLSKLLLNLTYLAPVGVSAGRQNFKFFQLNLLAVV